MKTSENTLSLLLAAPHPGERAMHNDQVAIAEALLALGYSPEQILMLHGRMDRYLVLAALDNLKRRMAGWESGSFFVHVSGHGYVVDETSDAQAGLWLAESTDIQDDFHLLWADFFDALRLPTGVRLTLLPDL